jgi:hypothetical protein
MRRGSDGLWRTVGGIVVSENQQKELNGMSDKTTYERIQAGEFENPVPFKSGATAEERRIRRSAEQEMTDKFRKVLEEDNGLSDHPKRDVLWRLAWDEGHSSGYAEVAIYYERFAELLKP